jgi:WD40-like Beta Propeller Repeat
MKTTWFHTRKELGRPIEKGASMKLHRIRCAVTFGLIILASLTAKSTSAQNQTGIIAFSDGCTGLLYAMRWDGSGRIALPLPSRPEPTDSYASPRVLDVTTSGPMTIVYYAGIIRIVEHVATLVDHGLFAVQIDDVGGVLRAEPPVRLSLPEIAGIDPNFARSGSFSPVPPEAFLPEGPGDRLAFVVDTSSDASVLMTAKVERDAALKITGLSDPVVVGDLYALGLPHPNFPTEKGFTGFIDYSPDGRSIVASIYYDLWMLSLRDDNTLLNSERLTENTDDFAEWNPSFSPDGSHIAYTSGAINSGRISGSVSSQLDIYSFEMGTRAVTRVTSNSNKGAAASFRNYPIWSSDGAWIGFWAYTSKTARNSPCSGLTNSEIFMIKADGSTTATQITNTNGTSVEAWPRSGW